MMIRNSKEEHLPTKQEGSTNDDHHRAPTNSKLWSGLKNPRIVRVSRAFGGKDRHSKVTTIRGLRDRRVRLSVPTAIQLYDLQDRLGLNQPSKAVDWLLNAAQHEIDKLPPLQLPSGNFVHYSQSLPISHDATPPQAPSHLPTAENSSVEGLATFPQSTFWNSVAPQRAKQRQDAKEFQLQLEEGHAIKGNELAANAQVSSQEPRPGHSFVSGLIGNAMPFTSYYHWEAYLSQLGIHSSQGEAPSFRTLGPESQVVFCPSAVMPPMFPSFVAATTTTTTAADFDARQLAHLQLSGSGSASQNPPPNSMRNSLQLGDPSSTRPFQ